MSLLAMVRGDRQALARLRQFRRFGLDPEFEVFRCDAALLLARARLRPKLRYYRMLSALLASRGSIRDVSGLDLYGQLLELVPMRRETPHTRAARALAVEVAHAFDCPVDICVLTTPESVRQMLRAIVEHWSRTQRGSTAS